jgi:hypothetical protein
MSVKGKLILTEVATRLFGKGKPVNIPVLHKYVRQRKVSFLTFWNKLAGTVIPVNKNKSRENHHDENLMNAWNSTSYEVSS